MIEELTRFAAENRFKTKGPLSVALVVTDHAKTKGLPLEPTTLITDRKGQVLGLGKAKVQSILARHGIERVLAEEAGRTSRGSMGNMETYVAFLNELAAVGPVDLEAVEAFWVARVNDFFAAKPFSIKLDGNLSLRSVVRNLMAQAEARQKEVPGVMFLGTMMQHLVGAKLDIVIGPGAIVHHGSNQNDAADGRTGDFDICDVSIHVSTAPSEALIRKCRANIDAGLKPIIVSTRKGVVVAEGLSDNAGIGDRVDVIEFEQFIATNIYEIGKFVPAERRATVEGIIARYNEIVSAHETDPSLRIELAPGR